MKRIALIAFFALMLTSVAHAEDRLERTKRIDRAITVILRDGIKRHKIKPRPGHRMLKSEDLRWELATAIEDATNAYPVVSPYLLIAIGFREGSFDNSSIGGIGEKTTFQMIPRVVRYVHKIDQRCHTKTYSGSAFCAATLLNHLVKNVCGTIGGAVLYYATGYTCKPRPERKKHAWLIWDRMGIANYLRVTVTKEQSE